MKYTDLQEGTVVRCIQRVDELIKNIRIAAKNLESIEFQAKLERASNLIRRDIVFSPSLYTQQEVVHVENEDQIESELQINFDQIDESDSTQNEFLDSNDFFSYNFVENEHLDSEAVNEEQFSSNFI